MRLPDYTRTSVSSNVSHFAPFLKKDDRLNVPPVVGQTVVDPSGTPLLDILVFRHEFVSIFRYSHSARVHPLELRVLEPLDDHAVRYEPDNGSVFLAKDLMAHLKRILDATAMFNRTGRPVQSRQRR